MLFTDEVGTMKDLVKKLGTLDQDFGKIKVATVCFIFDKTGNLVLHRRGPGARDEIGKLQAIGGSVNKNDLNLRESLARELREEAGSNCEIKITKFIGAQLDGKIDKTTGEFVNWIILAYEGRMLSGELENLEPERCVGFEHAPLDGFKREDLSDTAYNFIQAMLSNR